MQEKFGNCHSQEIKLINCKENFSVPIEGKQKQNLKIQGIKGY